MDFRPSVMAQDAKSRVKTNAEGSPGVVRPSAGLLRLLAAIRQPVPDLAETAISEPVYSRIGLCMDDLGQKGALSCNWGEDTRGVAGDRQRSAGERRRTAHGRTNPAPPPPRFRGKSRDIRMLVWAARSLRQRAPDTPKYQTPHRCNPGPLSPRPVRPAQTTLT